MTTNPAPSRSRWLAWSRGVSSGTARLFCFPGAGAGASFYNDLAAELPPAVQLCAIQLPGRQNRIDDPAFSDMATLARAAADVLASELDRPFCLLGHSMGGLVAFEVARELARRGLPQPRCLFLAAAAAPDVPSWIHEVAEWDPAMLDDKLDALADSSAYEGLDNQELRALVMSTLRADLELCARYRPVPDPVLECPVTVLGGTDDDDVSMLDLYAWRGWFPGSVTIMLLPGDHLFIRPQRRTVAALVVQALEGNSREAP